MTTSMTPRVEEAPNLRDYVRLLWDRRWLIALSVAVAAGSALTFSSRQAPIYEAQASVFIGPGTAGADDLNTAFQELVFSRELMASYAEIITSRPLVERVIAKEQLGLPPGGVSERLDARVLESTRIIEVTYRAGDPESARDVVNALTESFVNEELEDFGGRAGVQASVLEPALLPQEPVSPQPLRNGLLGAALGLALGIGTAFLLEQLDTTIRTREDAEDAFSPIPVLAAVPHADGEAKGRKLFFELGTKHPTTEAFRILRTNLQSFGVDKPLHKVMVASPYAEEGKSTVAANLALSQAVAGSRTVLVETDLRRPVMHEYFDVPAHPGLADVLVSTDGITEAVKTTRFQNLWVVLAGRIPPNPSELIGSQSMKEIAEQLASNAEFVVFDTPPSLPVSDASQLARLCDGVVLVVRAGRTHKQHARQAIEDFERNGAKVLGVVLNDVDSETAGYYYYHYYYHYQQDQQEEPKRRLFRRRSRGYVPSRQLPTSPATVDRMRGEASGVRAVEPGAPSTTVSQSAKTPSSPSATPTAADQSPAPKMPSELPAADLGLTAPDRGDDAWKESTVARDIERLRNTLAERTGPIRRPDTPESKEDSDPQDSDTPGEASSAKPSDSPSPPPAEKA